MNDQNVNGSENPYYSFTPVPNPDEVQKKTHSKLGIASFIIGLVSLIVFIVAIIVMSSFIMDQFGNEGNYNTLRTDIENRFNDVSEFMPVLAASLMMLFSFACCLVGLILGIVGACAKAKHKTFPVIGIVVNALLPAGFISLFVLGLAMSGTT